MAHDLHYRGFVFLLLSDALVVHLVVYQPWNEHEGSKLRDARIGFTCSKVGKCFCCLPAVVAVRDHWKPIWKRRRRHSLSTARVEQPGWLRIVPRNVVSGSMSYRIKINQSLSYIRNNYTQGMC